MKTHFSRLGCRTTIFAGAALLSAMNMGHPVGASEFYFSQAITNGPLGTPVDLGTPGPVPERTTGQIDAPVASMDFPHQILFNGPNGFSYTGAPQDFWAAGSATASADRTTGQLHASAGTTIQGSGGQSYGANATAVWGDTLTFGSASPTLATYVVGFHATVEGTFLPPPVIGLGNGEAIFTLAVGQTPYSFPPGYYNPPTSPNITSSFLYDHAFFEYQIGNIVNETIHGSIAFSTNGQLDLVDIPILMQLTVGDTPGFAAFFTTANFAFDPLPPGLSWTSASGDFLTTPPEVPLPGALPLFATGLGALGLLGWRRKKKAALAA